MKSKLFCIAILFCGSLVSAALAATISESRWHAPVDSEELDAVL